MPALYILGGANGAGKTTWYQFGIESKAIDADLPFINVDLIVVRELGGYNPENIAKAEQTARERMRHLLTERKDFMIESNLSKTADYEWIALMRKNGYDTILFFLGTSTVEINKIRVRARVLEGGHDVAAPIIEQRYQMGLSYLKTKLLDFSTAILFDVSTHEPRRMAELHSGQIVFKAADCPSWVISSLEVADKIALRGKSPK